jgi:hypothetical protein
MKKKTILVSCAKISKIYFIFKFCFFDIYTNFALRTSILKMYNRFQLNWNEGSVFTCASVILVNVFRAYATDMNRGASVIFS